MINTINDEVPDSENSLISIGIDLIRVVKLVSDQLMSLTSLEFHLFLEKS